MGKSNLGEFELIVLLSILQLGEDSTGKSRAHTLAIVDTIQQRIDRPVQRAAVYVTLQRLEKKGLVTSWLSEPRPERGGKGRRHVQIQPDGLQAVRQSRNALRNMWQGLETALEQA